MMTRRIAPFLVLTLLFSIGCRDSEWTAREYGPQFAGSGEDDPPLVLVYDIDMVEIDQLTVDAGESFTLIGRALGAIPFVYRWFRIENGSSYEVTQQANPQYLIDHAIQTPGEYLIVFEVTDVNGLVGSDQVAVTVEGPSVVDVEIDIKPGSDPNSINLGSNGNVPVAIFSAVDFDATTIDPTTVKLADAAVRVVGKKGNLQASIEDVNGDGLPDLVVHIDTQGLALGAGDVVAVLTGETYDGTLIEGSDTVRIVP